MVGNPFAFASTLNPAWPPSFTPQAYPLQQAGYGVAPHPAQIQAAQQILQWLQVLPQQLQQLTFQQQQTLQQLLQVVPAQYQQLQQVVQLIPQLVHQLQHILAQPPAGGFPYAGVGIGGFGGIGTAQPFQAHSPLVPPAYAAQPSHVM